MKVLATRDDGAQLIGDPELPYALLASDDGASVLPVASALARGYWNWTGDAGEDAEVRPEDVVRIHRLSAEF